MSTLFGKGTDDPLARVLLCPTCRLYVRCVLYLDGELAWFDCERARGGCGTRYVLNLASHTLASEILVEQVA